MLNNFTVMAFPELGSTVHEDANKYVMESNHHQVKCQIQRPTHSDV